jgi:hypothetical protein
VSALGRVAHFLVAARGGTFNWVAMVWAPLSMGVKELGTA